MLSKFSRTKFTVEEVLSIEKGYDKILESGNFENKVIPSTY